MRWSKLKKCIEGNFASSVAGKICIYNTSYKRNGNGCNCGRAWMTYNKMQIVNFETIPFLNRICRDRQQMNSFGHAVFTQEERTPPLLCERGECSRGALGKACEQFLSMQIDDALVSENPIIRGLAFLDKRVGKRRLSILATDEELHPLPKQLLEIRKAEEQLASSQA